MINRNKAGLFEGNFFLGGRGGGGRGGQFDSPGIFGLTQDNQNNPDIT